MRPGLVAPAWAGGRRRYALLALLSSLMAACALEDDVIATRLRSTAQGGASAGGANSCPGFVPTIQVGLSSAMCAGWLGRRAFSHAICSCGDLEVLAVLTSEGEDSSTESAPGDRDGAAVGVNGNYAGGEYVRIGGSLSVQGNAQLSSRGGIDVAGDLRLAGATSAAGPIFVGRDAWLLEATSSLSLASVGRDLHLARNGALTALGPVAVAGQTLQEPFDIAAPCACADHDLIDIAGIVQAGLGQNDNGRVGLDLARLRAVQSPQQLTLSCGRFALKEISGDAAIELHIAGRVLLFVDGDVNAGRNFSLELEPGAQLDWFIRGNLALSPEALLGDNDHPGATRVYVLGAADIALPGTARFSAGLYAPRAQVTVGLLGDVYGSVFAAGVTSLGPLLAHYDRALLYADQHCPLPAPSQCDSCEQCGTSASCVGTTCGACSADSDCCFPLVCEMGACQTLGSE